MNDVQARKLLRVDGSAPPSVMTIEDYDAAVAAAKGMDVATYLHYEQLAEARRLEETRVLASQHRDPVKINRESL